jgi:hypothetical protein
MNKFRLRTTCIPGWTTRHGRNPTFSSARSALMSTSSSLVSGSCLNPESEIPSQAYPFLDAGIRSTPWAYSQGDCRSRHPTAPCAHSAMLYRSTSVALNSKRISGHVQPITKRSSGPTVTFLPRPARSCMATPRISPGRNIIGPGIPKGRCFAQNRCLWKARWPFVCTRLSSKHCTRNVEIGLQIYLKSGLLVAMVVRAQLSLLFILNQQTISSFPDVGGGSVPNGTRHSLARITLRWMVRECFKTNSGIMFNAERLREIGLDPTTLWPEVLERHVPLSVPKGMKVESPPSWLRTKTFSWLFGTRGLTPVDSSTAREPPHSEEEEELQDALSPIYNGLSENPAWWILEIIPMRHCYQKGDKEWVSWFGFVEVSPFPPFAWY